MSLSASMVDYEKKKTRTEQGKDETLFRIYRLMFNINVFHRLLVMLWIRSQVELAILYPDVPCPSPGGLCVSISTLLFRIRISPLFADGGSASDLRNGS